MELASMLAGEPFTDRPHCVDPVLAGYLRAFNDRLGHVRRQELLPYAAAVVGTRGDRRVTRARRRRCARLAGGRLRITLRVGLRAALRRNDGPGAAAAREVIARGWDGFAFLDALLADGGITPPRSPAPIGNAPAPAGVKEACARLPSLSAS
jgi:hypothetical protein